MGISETRDVPSIPEFYKGKSILITGGTGFLGQTLVEKLLYSCTDLDKIYLIIRSKRGVCAKERLKTLYETMCFQRLRDEKPGVFESKVVAIDGDTSKKSLGLSDKDKQLLIDNVDIVFNSAASVKFDDHLHVAAKLNLSSAKEAVELAKQMKKLCAFIHISTAFSNSDRHNIDEVLYPPKADWRDTLDICENLEPDLINAFTHKYLGSLPNTYIFTKQLAESLVADQKGVLPAIIVRPSIVIASLKEPFVGWVNSFNGPTGIIVACGKGIMRSIFAKPDTKSDMVPVDIVTRELITVAWYRGIKKLDPSDDVTVYNLTNSDKWHITWKIMTDNGKEISEEYPMDGVLWYTRFTITSCPFYHYIKVMTLQVGQAIIFDLLLWLLGRKTMLLKIQRKIFAANIAVKYFMTHEWNFRNDNVVALQSMIKEEDKEEFCYGLDHIGFVEYYRAAAISGIDNFLKESKKDLKTRKANLFKLYVLDMIVTTLLCLFILWLFVNSGFFQRIVTGFQQFFDV